MVSYRCSSAKTSRKFIIAKLSIVLKLRFSSISVLINATYLNSHVPYIDEVREFMLLFSFS